MNGLTGFKTQKIFKALVSESVYDNARYLVEYCCFRFLSRDNSFIHPCLKEPAFQRLIFITMLAWESPYHVESDSDEATFQGKLVGKEAFVRIAPAISGVADYPTAHNLFKALAGDEQGISLTLWLTYVHELLKVHEGRKSYQTRECPQLSEETVLCIGSSNKRPVLKWSNNMAWPGKVTLTDKSLYFEAVGLNGRQEARRLDLTRNRLQVDKTKVGPMGSALFDSAVCISSGPKSETWVLEFVDLGGELRRDVWHAFISEVIALHKFLSEFGPLDGDHSLLHVYGAKKGKERAIASAINSIARLQTLQFMRKLLDDPIKLVQFSYLQSAPYGDIVYQTLAVNYWAGPLLKRSGETEYQPAQRVMASDETMEIGNHVVDIDGSVYLRRWMRSPSWNSSASINFWKNCVIKKGIALSKNLVVADQTCVEKAAFICTERFQVVEKTQATIDAAKLTGIPSNIDLFKELLLPLTMATQNFEKLRRWEDPQQTIYFLVFAYVIIFRNFLPYIFPAMLMVLAAGMLTLKGLKEQGRLGRFFGKVTILDQPPSNTIQKIVAVKEAMRDVENYLQNLNVSLLKIRTIVLSGEPKITTEVAVVLLSFAAVLLFVPFKYVAAFLLLDLFTRELDFRKETARRVVTFLKERWNTVPAAPVVVLPFQGHDSPPENTNTNIENKQSHIS
ncbi:hypothetical protein K2173_021212 [Erythroxylum novogranatense]|uniref:DUF639 domain-containing protein n=1 Tax=Erythroxylum novogranatense TaxID=1862640 RepID=A0AAV8TN35_9ROSI|nr:hypothetical protein K2173_021212 [Erythroxylum novogranatense]